MHCHIAWLIALISQHCKTLNNLCKISHRCNTSLQLCMARHAASSNYSSKEKSHTAVNAPGIPYTHTEVKEQDVSPNRSSKSLICRVFQHFDPASTLSSKLVLTSLTAEPLSCCSTTQFAGTANHVTVSVASQIYPCLAIAELHATARRDQRRVVGFAGQLPSMAAHTKTPSSGSYHAYTLCRRASTPTHEHSSTISGDVKCSLAC
jgi:hypothetical protein